MTTRDTVIGLYNKVEAEGKGPKEKTDKFKLSSDHPGSQSARGMATEKIQKKSGKRGRKPAQMDVKAKLERSRQSARECRARKKLRYQYLEELVASRERSVIALREELETYKQYCKEYDEGKLPKHVQDAILKAKADEKST